MLTLPDGGLELAATSQDEVVSWAYSSIGGLVAACGSGQPYVRASVGDVADFADAFDGPVLVALDVWHPEGVRYSEVEPDAMEPLEPLSLDDGDEDVVWVPTRPVREGDWEVVAELHAVEPGEPLLLAYSSLETLLANCGPHQAASAIFANRIDVVAEQAGAHGVAFDAAVAEEARHRAPVRHWARPSRNEYPR
ncbi:MAG: hypothetical protein GEU97_22995 [Actinophytocola sp.]|nr:hypothetical protein [Actinophytocola sp.]